MGGYNAVGAPVLAGSGLRLNELVPWSLFDSRRYLEHNPSSPKFLLTVRGVGYKFVPNVGDGRT